MILSCNAFCWLIKKVWQSLMWFLDGDLCSRKQMSQLESEKRYLEKSNRHLENILEATNAYKNKEVSELNRIHVETIKVSKFCVCIQITVRQTISSVYSVCFCCPADLTLTSIVKNHSLVSSYLFYQILTTPTKAYNLRSRFVPLSSPEHLNGTGGDRDDIWDEEPPSDMTEMALTEELRQVQVQKQDRKSTRLNSSHSH